MNIFKKNSKVIYLLVFFTLFSSCKEDEQIEITVTSNDFSIRIDENPKADQIIGIVESFTNNGGVTYSFESQSPDGAFRIDPKTGELRVADSTLFDYEINKQLTAVVIVNNMNVSSQSLITVELNDIETKISAEDMTIAMSENPKPGMVLDTIAAEAFESNIKVTDLSYSVVSQMPNGALSVNEKTGELYVSNADLFDFETNPNMVADLLVSDGAYQKEVKLLINLSDAFFKQITTSETIFTERLSHQVVTYNNKIWLIGGLDLTNTEKNDIWSSEDASNWVLEKEDAAFSGRMNHQVVRFNEKFWMIGGRKANVELTNEVWSSNNGIDWNEEQSAPFSVRDNHQAIVFNNKLWVVGGWDEYNTNNVLNDIWSTDDGITWTNVTNNAAFSGRIGHELVVFNNKLMLIGGIGVNNTYLNDIWSSIDGVNWTKESVIEDHFSGRHHHQVLVYENVLWLIGGDSQEGRLNDVWFSNDGLEWSQVEISGDHFTAKVAHQMTKFNNDFYVIGGRSSDGSKNDVWVID